MWPDSPALPSHHKHRDQRRKRADAAPYINHPLAGANILWHEGSVRDGAVTAAALLRDTIEDTETSYDELVVQFGTVVAEYVQEVTDPRGARLPATFAAAARALPRGRRTGR
jgi:guanosine-3',5'-bis(diphosphate) 3'-pyrophosphohydrolase